VRRFERITHKKIKMKLYISFQTHPDDVELVSGTILKEVALGKKLCDLTRGELGTEVS
jgi:hypothetical protein